MDLLILLLGGLLVGGCLGLLGSGGSILTVPVLVYLLGHAPEFAIAESLAIVGAIAAVGAIGPIRRGAVDWRSVVFFGVPAMVGTAGGAWLGGAVAPLVQLVTFAAVMIAAAVAMLRGGRRISSTEGNGGTRRPRGRLGWIVLEGVGVGILTGFVGVGGGFLIVPALVMLGGLTMSVAVGTSLVVIAIKSGAGFAEYLHQFAGGMDWAAIGLFSAIGSIGSVAGASFGRRLDERILKRTFAIVVLLMGVAIMVVELGGLRPAPEVPEVRDVAESPAPPGSPEASPAADSGETDRSAMPPATPPRVP